MSVLPDKQIKRFSWGHLPANEFAREDAVKNGKALISPFTLVQLQPSSYDVLLSDQIRVPVKQWGVIDMRETPRDDTELVDITNGFLLAQGHFVLGSTYEKVSIPHNMVGRIEGKSTRARQGLQIHSAGYLDPGFRGNVTLELVNFSPRPMMLYPGIRVAQLSFEWLDGYCDLPYSKERNHYQDSEGTVGPTGDEQ